MSSARPTSAPSDVLQLLPNHAQQTLRAAVDYMFAIQRDDHHWCGELDSAPNITAEYVFLCQALGLDMEARCGGIAQWLLSHQKEDGSYGLTINTPGNLHSTAEIYLALKILGLDAQHPAMQKARAYVLSQGGLAKVRIFSRIYFSMFGLFDWRDVPAMPPEIMLLPPAFAINIYSLSMWARTTVVPLFVLAHHKPIYALPNGRHSHNDYLDELWVGKRRRVPYLPPWRQLWRDNKINWTSFFAVTDVLLKGYEKIYSRSLRQLALKRCTDWILQHQEPEGDWAGFFPPICNNLLALPLQGYDLTSHTMRAGLAGLERFAIHDAGGRRVQACSSPVWDTVLGLIGLRDAGHPGDDPRMVHAAEWVLAKQTTHVYGDWAIYRPNIPPGGWAFEYFNTWHPDVDDTAAVLLALLKQDTRRVADSRVHVAVEWMLGMQNRDGGWGAFEAENDKVFLNDAPFTDMRALSDPSTADVTGRILEALGMLLGLPHPTDPPRDPLPEGMRKRIHTAIAQALPFLRLKQEPSGAWWGRWGINYLYGTSHVLCGLQHVPWACDGPTIARGVQWLKRVQNRDGGWGETPQTYGDPTLAGQGASTASQTAWGLMGLLAHLPPTDPSIEAGIAWLARAQKTAAEGGSTWLEPEMTATRFPNHLYVRYDLYRHYFPMMALGRYEQALGRLPDPLRSRP